MISNFVLEIDLVVGCEEENSSIANLYLLLCSLNSLLVFIVVCSICCNLFPVSSSPHAFLFLY